MNACAKCYGSPFCRCWDISLNKWQADIPEAMSLVKSVAVHESASVKRLKRRCNQKQTSQNYIFLYLISVEFMCKVKYIMVFLRKVFNKSERHKWKKSVKKFSKTCIFPLGCKRWHDLKDDCITSFKMLEFKLRSVEVFAII